MSIYEQLFKQLYSNSRAKRSLVRTQNVTRDADAGLEPLEAFTQINRCLTCLVAEQEMLEE